MTDEADTTNNCSSAVAVTVGATPAPDLVVDSPTVSESAPSAGARFTLNATVRNQGSGESVFTTLRYYQSADSTITTADTQVGTDPVFRLDASASGAESISLTAPSTPGTYYYGACVDAVSKEADATNNCSVAVAVTVGAAPVPDLVVDSPTVSDSAPAAGARIILNATVRNQGRGSSGFTRLHFYQSTDSTIPSGDRLLGTNGVPGLTPSESESESFNVTAPSTPGTYYYGACVDAVSKEADATNNCSVAVAVTVGAAPVPDLVVDSPTVSDSAPAAGARITLSASVRNQGSGSSASTMLRYYQSTDSVITTGDTEVGTDSVFRLDASASGAESLSLTAPSTPGTYYYGACVDTVTDEADTTNNCSSAVAVTVGATPAPDLVVDSPTVSESAPSAGARFTLNATVRNQGSGESVFTTLRYYQSTDSAITTGDTEVGTDSVSRLNASESGPESISLTAPSTPGTYYYGACVDTVTDEADTTNNCSSSVAVTVRAEAAPDLVVDRPVLSNASPVAGASFPLSVTVRNQGIGRSNATTLSYYRSTDATITTSDTVAGTSQVGGLSASGTKTVSTVLPGIADAGTYYLGACVDPVSHESDTTNNCSSSVEVTVTAPPSNPDLVVDMGGGTGTTVAGTSFDIQLAVRNQGTGATSASTTLRFYRSTDATITDGDTEVGTDSVAPLGGSNSISRHSINLTAPSSKGTYYYGACVDTVPSETNGANNCSSARALTITSLGPDLVVIQVNVPETDPIEGEDFWVGIHVENQGDYRALSPTARFYRSTDATISTTDTEIDMLRLLNMEASQRFESGSIKILTTAPSTAGTYYYGACIDSAAGESDTTNNCSSAEKVTVVSATGSDLVIQSFRISAIEVYFPTLPLYATVLNQGTGSAASTPVSFYLSTDATITTNDTRIDGQYVKRLAPSETGTAQVTTTAESTPGMYYYGACVKAVSGESDTTNNCSNAVAVTVESDDAASTPGKPTGLAATADGETGIDLTWTAPSDDGGEDITGYRIEVSTDGSTWSDLEDDTESTATSYSHTGLTAGSTRHYRVSAINSEGTGPASDTGSATTDAAPAPDLTVDAPTVNDNTLDTGDSFTLRVTVRNQGNAPSDSAKLSYQQSLIDSTFERGHRIVAVTSMAGLAVSGNILESTDLTAPSSPGTYYFRACVFAVSGEIDTTNNCSNAVEVTVESDDAASIPGKPTGLTATADGQTEIDLSWAAPSDDGGADITGYRIEVSTDGSSWSDLEADTGSSSTRYSHTGLAAGSTRHYRVSAINPEGTGPASDTGSAITDAATKPGKPTGLTATADGQTEIDLTWAAPTDDGGADITGYRIEVSTDGSSWSDLEADTGSSSTRYSHTGLAAGSTRHYRVSAINPEGTGRASDTDSAVTDAATKPGKPTGLTATADGQTEIDLSWTAPSDDGGADITGYRIEVSTDGSSWSDLEADTGSSSTRYSHTGLAAGSTRHYRVSAINSEGTGPASNTDSATTDTATAPDLTVDTPTVNDSTLETEDSFTLRATVRNSGDASSASTTLRYYLSTDSTITTSDAEVGTDSVSGLGASGTSDQSISLTAPSTAGTYYYGACVDSVSGESDTSNNCSSAVTVTVTAAQEPDPTPAPGPTGKGVTGKVTGCTGEQVAPGIDSYRITIAGTLTANRDVESVRVTGTFNGSFVGIDVVGDMNEGETKSFSVTGYVSESVGTCGADVEWLEVS